MLCEDPVAPDMHPFIYHYETKTMLRAIHRDEQDTLSQADLDEIMEQPNYALQYGDEIIYIIAIDIDMLNVDFVKVTSAAAEWYAEYLSWEDDQNG